MKRALILVVAALLAVTVTACVRAKRPAQQPTASKAGATLWEPSDVDAHDLFLGPWGREHAPDHALDAAPARRAASTDETWGRRRTRVPYREVSARPPAVTR